MILGIGTDICAIARIEKVVKRQEGFASRVLTESELAEYHRRASKPSFLASRFAAKEAALKALGTGLAQGISWQDLEVSNLESGQPVLSFYNQAKCIADEKGVKRIHLSLTDEKEYAVAFVILEAN